MEGFNHIRVLWEIRLELKYKIVKFFHRALLQNTYLSRLMRKPTICICETKGTEQLCSNCEADQCLCFRYMDSTVLFLDFLMMRLIYTLGTCIQSLLHPMCPYHLWSSRIKWYVHVEHSKGWIAKIYKLNVVAQERLGKPRKSWYEVLVDDDVRTTKISTCTGT